MEPPTVPADGEPFPAETPAGILARIDAREREIERALHGARDTAAAIVQEARDRARSLVAARQAAAAREAAERGARIQDEARRDAEEIQAAGAREAAAIRATPAARIEQAADALLAVVLPAGGTAERGR